MNGYPVRRIPNFYNDLCNFDLNAMEWVPLKSIDVWYTIWTKEELQNTGYKIEEE